MVDEDNVMSKEVSVSLSVMFTSHEKVAQSIFLFICVCVCVQVTHQILLLFNVSVAESFQQFKIVSICVCCLVVYVTLPAQPDSVNSSPVSNSGTNC